MSIPDSNWKVQETAAIDVQTGSADGNVIIPKQHRKRGRPQIRRGVIYIYFNVLFDSIIIPYKALNFIEKPTRIEVLLIKDKKRLLFHSAETVSENTFDVPPQVYEDAAGINIEMPNIVDQVRNAMGWDDYTYAAEGLTVVNLDQEKFILCDLYTSELYTSGENETIPEKHVVIGHSSEDILQRKGWKMVTRDVFKIHQTSGV